VATRLGRDSGRWKRLRAAFRAECRRQQARCWLCSQPIDYALPSDDPNSFSVDHVETVAARPELAETWANLRQLASPVQPRARERAAAARPGTTEPAMVNVQVGGHPAVVILVPATRPPVTGHTPPAAPPPSRARGLTGE
jgi:hypothetical protein